MITPTIPGIAIGPLPKITSRNLFFGNFSSPVIEFDSLSRLNARALNIGSQGSVNAGLITGINAA